MKLSKLHSPPSQQLLAPILHAFLVTSTQQITMNNYSPALVILHAVVLAVMILSLVRVAQLLIVALVVCPPHAAPTPNKTPEPEPTTETEDAPIPLNFDLLENHTQEGEHHEP